MRLGNVVDDRAADMLRSASPIVQSTVIRRGGLDTASNPSAALVSRICGAKVGKQKSWRQWNCRCQPGLREFACELTSS